MRDEQPENMEDRSASPEASTPDRPSSSRVEGVDRARRMRLAEPAPQPERSRELRDEQL